jgi:hypothetical protein
MDPPVDTREFQRPGGGRRLPEFSTQESGSGSLRNPSSGSGFMIAGAAALLSGLSCGEAPGAVSQESGKVQTVSDFRLTQAEGPDRAGAWPGHGGLPRGRQCGDPQRGQAHFFSGQPSGEHRNLRLRPGRSEHRKDGPLGIRSSGERPGSKAGDRSPGMGRLLGVSHGLPGGVHCAGCGGRDGSRGRGVTLSTGLGAVGDVTVSQSFQGIYSGEVTGID